MISRQFINEIAVKSQTLEANVAREYCQHLFLSHFNKVSGSEKFLFKGGTALRIVFGSPRFSEDLDFSAKNSGSIRIEEINRIIDEALFQVQQEGIEVAKNFNPGTSGETSGGYFVVINMQMLEFDSELQVQISFRTPDKVIGNSTLLNSSFISPYVINYLHETILVGEKIEALLDRKKPRDFYDLYFILRSPSLVKFISGQEGLKDKILKTIDQSGDFEKELKIFLPIGHHQILKDFKGRLKNEVEINIGN
jgi:predicted nucleotidyltransferase component of viral defense system